MFLFIITINFVKHKINYLNKDRSQTNAHYLAKTRQNLKPFDILNNRLFINYIVHIFENSAK